MPLYIALISGPGFQAAGQVVAPSEAVARHLLLANQPPGTEIDELEVTFDDFVTVSCPGCGQEVDLPTPEALRAARKSARLTLADVASVLGVSVSYLSQVERGRKGPTPKIVNHYKTFLKI